MAKILIVDDEKKMCAILASSLEDEGHQVQVAHNGSDALAKIQEPYDIVITDLRMPDMDGLEILKACKSQNNNTDVILMTAHATADTAVTAMKEGAFDYLLKPFSLDDLFEMVSKIMESKVKSHSQHKEGNLLDSNIIGKSSEMIRVYKLVGQIAQQDVTVLIRGESGTGKELVANSIHQASPRAHKPLVTINCTALPEALFENELFGHDREAFTGASSKKVGKFEAAHGGTLFLDEIGDLSLATQGKLLRVLEQKSFQRVGGNETIEVDVRIVAATNVDLEKAVEKKEFRQDLFYRLNVFPIKLPALRHRQEDIQLLTDYFIQRIGGPVHEINQECLSILEEYTWPGNVRQLENTIISSVLRSKGPILLPENLPPELFHVEKEKKESSPIPLESQTLDLAKAERQLIDQAIEKAGGNKTKAAKMLGITRRALYSKLKIHEEKEGREDPF